MLIPHVQQRSVSVYLGLSRARCSPTRCPPAERIHLQKGAGLQAHREVQNPADDEHQPSCRCCDGELRGLPHSGVSAADALRIEHERKLTN